MSKNARNYVQEARERQHCDGLEQQVYIMRREITTLELRLDALSEKVEGGIAPIIWLQWQARLLLNKLPMKREASKKAEPANA